MNEDDLRALTERLNAGEITAEEFQQAIANAVQVPISDPANPNANLPVGDPSPEPPSPLHVWNGTAYVLPAEHELAMLAEMDEVDEGEAGATQQAAEERLADQQHELAEESA